MAAQAIVEMNEFVTPELAAQEYLKRLLHIARQIAAPHTTGLPPEFHPAIKLMSLHVILEHISMGVTLMPQDSVTQKLYGETVEIQGMITEGINRFQDKNARDEEFLAERLRALREQYHPSSST